MMHITLSQIVKIPNSKHFFHKFVQKFAFDKYRKLATKLLHRFFNFVFLTLLGTFLLLQFFTDLHSDWFYL